VAETIWQQREQFLAGGRLRPERLTATVLFTDLEGFTSVSEKHTPDEIMAWLNEYMEAMAQRISDYGGVINKYIGDAIMAIFGVPLAHNTEAEIRQDVEGAVRCALAMENELKQLNQRWYEHGLPTIGMRVGIHTGPLVAGSLGSSQRLEYTVIGDTVNIASRLESFDKTVRSAESPCRILVGGATAHYLTEKFTLHELGNVLLKGREEMVTVYQVLGATN
jgi:adenylate cyclase